MLYRDQWQDVNREDGGLDAKGSAMSAPLSFRRAFPVRLKRLNFVGLQPLGSLHHLELNLLPFL